VTNLVVPTVNLNGNDADDLVAQLRDVLKALDDANSQMGAASDIFHGRNFQLADDPQRAQFDAQIAWTERRLAIIKMRDEIMELALAVQEQGRVRA